VPSRRIAVVSGGGRAGRLVASLLATALDDPRDEHRAAIYDAGTVVGAPAWVAAVTGADQLVVAVDAVGPGPAEALTMLAALSRTHSHENIDAAITVVLLPPARRGLSRGHEDIATIREHFLRRTRAVFFAANDAQPTKASRAAWQRIAEELARRPRRSSGRAQTQNRAQTQSHTSAG
jgi:hypothetical protein